MTSDSPDQPEPGGSPHGSPGGSPHAHPGGGRPADPRRGFVVLLAAVLVSAPLVLAAGGWPRWWSYIAPEQTPMTWLQSVVLILAAAAAALMSVAVQSPIDQQAPAPIDQKGPARVRRGWRLLAVGLALLAIDERFALHERLRDGVLAPRDIGPGFLPWVAPGDVVLLGVAIVGLCLLPWIWAAVSADRWGRRALFLAIGISVLTVSADSVDPTTWGRTGERWEQTIEEVLELAAGLCLLATAALPLLDRIRTPARRLAA